MTEWVEVVFNSGSKVLSRKGLLPIYGLTHGDDPSMVIQSKRGGIKAHHVLKAAQKWREQTGYGGFRPSRHYDVIIQGEHFPPKAIVAIANELAGGGKMRPADFPGAWDGKWHREL